MYRDQKEAKKQKAGHKMMTKPTMAKRSLHKRQKRPKILNISKESEKPRDNPRKVKPFQSPTIRHRQQCTFLMHMT